MNSSYVQTAGHPGELIRQFFHQKSYTQIVVLTDSNTQAHCYPLVATYLPTHYSIEVKPGEEYKNIDTCNHIWQRLTDLDVDRHGLILVLGGGVLGDMGGFCAATYKRGIDFVLMPTTLLAQIDASIGGKLGVDFSYFKNQIGVFKEPVATLILPLFLNTLPERELRSGFAEIIKHCLIADRAMWHTILTKNLPQQNWQELIPHSIDIKKKITTNDPSEKGERKVLNVGHTMGHALESYYLAVGSRIFHGEAIAMGIIMESYIAHKKGLLTQSEMSEITHYLLGIFGKEINPFEEHQIVRLVLQDKKNRNNKVLMALLHGIGKAVWDQEVSEAEIKAAMHYYQQCPK